MQGEISKPVNNEGKSRKKVNGLTVFLVLLLIGQVVTTVVLCKVVMYRLDMVAVAKLHVPERLDESIMKSVQDAIDKLSENAKKPLANMAEDAAKTCKSFSVSLDQMLGAAQKDIRKAGETVVASMTIETNRAEIAVSSALERLDRRMRQIETSCSTASDGIMFAATRIKDVCGRDEAKLSALLRAARDPKNSDEVRTIMYLSALDQAESKGAILEEYVKMQSEAVAKDIQAHSVDEAHARAIAVSEVVGAASLKASPDDMECILRLKAEMNSLVSQCEELVAKNAVETRIRLLSITNGFEFATADNAALERLQLEIESVGIPDEVSADKEELMNVVSTWAAAEVPLEGAISFPRNATADVINKWCTNFCLRIYRKNVSAGKKLEDVVAASEYINSLTAGMSTNTSEIAALLVAVKGVCSDYLSEVYRAVVAESVGTNVDWQAVAKKTEAVLEQESTLHEYGVTFDERQLITLKALMIAGTLDGMNQEWKMSKGLEKTIVPDAYLQVLSMFMTQYAQLAIKMRSECLNTTVPTSYLYDEVVARLNAFSCLYQAKSNERTMTSLTDQEYGEKRYLDRVKSDIEGAKSFYNRAEKKASEYFTTKRNGDVQADYRMAWMILARIHPDDLRSISPEDCLVMETLKAKCEADYHVRDSERADVSYYRLSEYTRPNSPDMSKIEVVRGLERTKEWLKEELK